MSETVNDVPSGYPVSIYMVATDSFMSGWGKASGGKSYYAVACSDHIVAADVERRMRARSEFKRVRDNLKPPRLGPNDHLHIVPAEQFTYQPGS